MQTVTEQFGDQFAKAVFVLKPGAWHGPFASSFGLHLVRVTEAKPARQLAFSEVEPQVRDAGATNISARPTNSITRV